MSAMTQDRSSPDQNRARKVELATRLTEGRISGKFDYLDDLTTPEIVFTIAGDRNSCPLCGRYAGRPAVRNALRLMHVTWEFFDDLDPNSLIVDGDHVVFQRASRWRSRGSGRTLHFDGLSHVVLEGDRVSECTLFLDTAVLATFED